MVLAAHSERLLKIQVFWEVTLRCLARSSQCFNDSIFRVKQSFLGIKLYNTLTLPVLLYGSETWTIKAKDTRRITAADMKYMRRTAGYTCTDYKTNTQIAKKLKITQILDKLLEYKRNWIQHVLQ